MPRQTGTGVLGGWDGTGWDQGVGYKQLSKGLLGLKRGGSWHRTYGWFCGRIFYWPDGYTGASTVLGFVRSHVDRRGTDVRIHT